MLKKYFEALVADAERDYAAKIVRIVRPDSEALLLDCGCGSGELTAAVARALGTATAIGLDIRPQALMEARRLAVLPLLADLRQPFPLRSQSCDVILANQVIEHLSDTDSFVEEVKRVLKPDGYSIICTENLSSWHNLFALFLGFQPFSLTNISTRGSIGNPLALHRRDATSETAPEADPWMMHQRLFAPRGLKEMFEVHGFEVEHFVGAGYYPLPSLAARWINRWTSRHAAFVALRARKSVSSARRQSGI